MKTSVSNLALLLSLLLILSTTGFSANYYVSPTGNDSNPGSPDYPLKSAQGARDAIRAYRQQHSGTEKHTVVFEDGVYTFSEPLELTPKDNNVTYLAKNKNKVSFTTAPQLDPSQFRPTTAQEKRYLQPSARNNVLVAEIDPVTAEAFGPGQGDYGMLTWNEHVLQLAQWPNRGFNHIDKVYDVGPTWRWLEDGENPLPFSYEKPCGGKFSMKEKFDFEAWKNELTRTQDIEQNGYLSIDWTREVNMVARISNNGIFQLLDSTRYGIGDPKNSDRKPRIYPEGKDPGYKNRRLFFRNVLYELDMPGEFYFDRKENKLYLWPIDSNLSQATITIPSGPRMLKMANTSHISFENIIFENGGDEVFKIEDADHVRFAGCTFRNLKGRAGVINGTNTGFQSCDFYNMSSCVVMGGGKVKNFDNRNDYKVESESIRKLEKSGNFITNCIIHDLWNAEYGAISMIGCGITFSNNVVYHVISGIWYSGIYIEFINNEFYEVGIGMGDWNIVYQGGNIWCNGNRVANNFFHHMFQTPSFHGVIASRNDDGGSGTTYESNIFFKTGCGAVVSMGPSCHIKNNIVLDTTTIWRTNKRPVSPKDIEKEYKQIRDNFESGKFPRGAKEDRIYNVESAVGKEGWNQEIFLSAFPNFAKYMAQNPFAQSYSSVTNNYSNLVNPQDPYGVIYIHGSFQLTEDDGVMDQADKMAIAFPKSFKYNEPQKISYTDFYDFRNMDFRLKPEFKPLPGFVPCDVEKVGLYPDTFRPNPPQKHVYRQATYDRHKFHITDPKGLSYNAEEANKWYPTQSWIEEEPSTTWAPYPFLSGIEDIGWFARVPVRRDTGYHGDDLKVGGKTYDRGILLFPDEKHGGRAELKFNLASYPAAKGIAATIGIEDIAHKNGSCFFIVEGLKKGKWEQLYKSLKITGESGPKEMTVNLNDCTQFKLITTDAGDGVSGDHAVWANVRFTE